jgi:hypothetical protein
MNTTRQQLDGLAAQSVVPVAVPEWGGLTVHVRTLTISQVVALEGIDGTRDQEHYAALTVIAGACEADGTPMFGPADLEYVKRQLPGLGTLRVAKAVMRVNHLLESEDEAKNG